MEEFTKFLCSISDLNISTQTVVLSAIFAIAAIIIKIVDNYKFDKYYNDMKNEKNKEIERLADDNRRYRDVYLKLRGINQEEIDAASAANINGG